MLLHYTIPHHMTGLRLDEALAALGKISKGEARRIIDRGGCALNKAMVRVASRQVKEGDQLDAGVMEPGRFQELLLPDEAILYQDAELIALAKPSGIPSQRTPYQLKGTLEYWVTQYFQSAGSNEPARVVHRLDRGTSGVMLFPRHRQGAARLSNLFRDGLIGKYYLLLVAGTPETLTWEVDAPIGKIAPARWGVHPAGRSAKTSFRVLATQGGLSLVGAIPHTGRTHQIRVHMAHSTGLAICGDSTYGGAPAARLLLHCHALCLTDMRGAPLTIVADLPPDMAVDWGEEKGDCAGWWLCDR